MLHGEVVASGGSGDELSVAVRAFSDPGDPGIEQLTLFNVRSVPVWTAAPGGCPAVFTAFVEHLSTSDAPFTLAIKGCAAHPGEKGQTVIAGPFLFPDPMHDGSRLTCNPLRSFPPTAACSDAVARANAATGQAQAACDQARRDRAERDAHSVVAAAAYVATAAFASAAAAVSAIPIVGTVLMAILVGLAAGALIIAIIQTLLANRANDAYMRDLEAFNAARQRRRDAMVDVGTNCCPDQAVVVPLGDCS